MNDTCRILDWTLFKPGMWKGTLYSPEMCTRAARTFWQLQGVLTPTVKLGHDRAQRLARSLGFPNIGQVTAVRADPRSALSLDLDNIPAEVGGYVNAGYLCAGSLELLPRMEDPRDTSKTIDGPIIQGVALLGEEQPALRGMPPPKATFADGREVPPAKSVGPWLRSMAAVSGQLERDATPFVAFSHLFGGPAVNPDSVNGGGVEMDSGDLNDLQERLKAAGIPPELLPLIVQVIGGTPKAPEQNTSADGGKAAQMSRLAEVAKKKLSDAVTDAKKDLELKERAFAAFSAGVNGSQPQLNEMTLGMLKHMRVTSPRVYERLTGRSAV